MVNQYQTGEAYIDLDVVQMSPICDALLQNFSLFLPQDGKKNLGKQRN